MPSALAEKAKAIAARDKKTFDALLEFEETKQMRSKTRLNFTIDKAIADRFRKYCREHGYTMSKKIEQAMRQAVEKNR